MNDILVILSAYFLDLLLGDPPWIPHPIRLIGSYISFLEGKLRRLVKTPVAERIGGTFLCLIVVFTVYGLTYFFLYTLNLISPVLHLLFSIFLAYTALAARNLATEAELVLKALESNDLTLARERLSRIVGRDTEGLGEGDVIRGTVESVAENTSDGIIAPVFYLVIGGVPLALAYKAINTLDSMVGYRNDRYLFFGWASARMDDVANYLPARITALLVAITSFILRLDWKSSFVVVIRDARNHPSPNAGYPEAAVAGALGLRLGGINYYFGKPHKRPFIGVPVNNFSIISIRNSIKIMYSVASIFILILIIVLFISERS